MIYAILDKDELIRDGITLEDYFNIISIYPHIPILQYKSSNNSLAEKREDLISIRNFYSETLIINNDIELIDDADGIHIDENDFKSFNDDLKEAVKIIRSKVGSKMIGLSIDTNEDIVKYNALGLDYVNISSYRSGEVKNGIDVINPKLVSYSKSSINPVAISGGVRLSDRFRSPIVYSMIGSDLYKNIED